MDRYDEAKKIVFDTRIFSINFLQRKLLIGYNEAAELLTKMEEEGLIDIRKEILLVDFEISNLKNKKI